MKIFLVSLLVFWKNTVLKLLKHYVKSFDKTFCKITSNIKILLVTLFSGLHLLAFYNSTEMALLNLVNYSNSTQSFLFLSLNVSSHDYFSPEKKKVWNKNKEQRKKNWELLGKSKNIQPHSNLSASNKTNVNVAGKRYVCALSSSYKHAHSCQSLF